MDQLPGIYSNEDVTLALLHAAGSAAKACEVLHQDDIATDFLKVVVHMAQQLSLSGPALKNNHPFLRHVCAYFHALCKLDGLSSPNKLQGYSTDQAADMVELARAVEYSEQEAMAKCVQEALSLHDSWCSRLQALLSR